VVVVLALLINPLLLDGWECGTSIYMGVNIWDWLRRPCLGVENPWVGGVEELSGSFPFAKTVTSLGGDDGEYVSAYVPAAERVEIPIRFYG